MITITHESERIRRISVNLTIQEDFENDEPNIPSFDLMAISEDTCDTPNLMKSAKHILAITPADSMCNNIQTSLYLQTETAHI